VARWISARSRRKAELAGFAASRGWAFTGRDDRWARIARRLPFGTGLYRLADDVMLGPVLHYRGVAFSYTGGSGSSRVRAGVYALELPVELPWVHVRAELPGEGVARLLGGQDIELESEDFNRAYRVTSEDPRFAYDLLCPRTMEELVAFRRLTVQVAGRFLVATGGRKLDLAWIDFVLGLLARMVDRLPDYVWTSRGVVPPRRGSAII
jgi:hypothetical protein